MAAFAGDSQLLVGCRFIMWRVAAHAALRLVAALSTLPENTEQDQSVASRIQAAHAQACCSYVGGVFAATRPLDLCCSFCELSLLGLLSSLSCQLLTRDNKQLYEQNKQLNEQCIGTCILSTAQ